MQELLADSDDEDAAEEVPAAAHQPVKAAQLGTAVRLLDKCVACAGDALYGCGSDFCGNGFCGACMSAQVSAV